MKCVVIWMERFDGVIESVVGFIVAVDHDAVVFWDHVNNRFDIRMSIRRLTQGKFPE